jgi:membrane protease YdiL (CAAX protease family)
MFKSTLQEVRSMLSLRWKPGWDLLAVAVSWLLVSGGLYAALRSAGPNAVLGLKTFLLSAAQRGAGSNPIQGLNGFLFYAVLTATIFGVAVPLVWMVIVRKRSLDDLGISQRRLWLSLGLQLIVALLVLRIGLSRSEIPSLDLLVPLVMQALVLGLFEAIFWWGWMLRRIEDAFGFLPAALITSGLYLLFHFGDVTRLRDIAVFFIVGLILALLFRLTGSVFSLWPFLQPAVQLVPLINTNLKLPMVSAMGYTLVVAVMGLLIWQAGEYARKN